jgi:hypothetical protein
MSNEKQPAVLARRMARELTLDEMKDVAGGIPPQTNWKKDHSDDDGSTGSQVVSTGIRLTDYDFRQDI